MSFTPVTEPHEPEWITNPNGFPGNKFCRLCGSPPHNHPRTPSGPVRLTDAPKTSPFFKRHE